MFSSRTRTITASGRSAPMEPFPPSPATACLVFAATAAQRLRRASTLHTAWRSIAPATYLLPIWATSACARSRQTAITTVPGTENLLAPRNVALDARGTLYISEFGGHRVRRLRSDGVVE